MKGLFGEVGCVGVCVCVTALRIQLCRCPEPVYQADRLLTGYTHLPGMFPGRVPMMALRPADLTVELPGCFC